MSLLRRSFPPFDEFVLVERYTMQWRSDSPFDLDAARFESALEEVYRFEHTERSPHSEGPHPVSDRYLGLLDSVVDLYAGDLLPSCYDEWIVGARERLHQGFLTTLEKLVEALETTGELGQAILYSQQLLHHDTLREENYRRLMHLHLATVGTVLLVGANQTDAEMGLQLTGDANNNNTVNSTDFSILKSSFGSTSDLRAHFNNDQVVSAIDFTLLTANFGQGGAPSIKPGG